MVQSKVEQKDKVFCPNIESEYSKMYDKEWEMHCTKGCAIPMSQCDYWKARAKDREILSADWQAYLLERK